MDAARIETDVLVIGGGAAGLMAAIEARNRGAEVLLLCKREAGTSGSTPYATANITCSTAESEQDLFRQMVEVGGYLNDQALLEVFVREVADIVPGLRAYGVPLAVVDGSHYHLVNYPDGPRPDLPGMFAVRPEPHRPLSLNLSIPLRETASRLGVKVLDHAMVTTVTVVGGCATGALALRLTDGQLLAISAGAVVLATGGAARLYARTDNPVGVTGDGFYLAFQAGAELVDMEMEAFNPLELTPDVRRMVRGGKPDDHVMATAMAHFSLGGVLTDARAESTVANLFAAGEVAASPFGAARLGGTSLAAAIVFGAIAGREAAARAKSTRSKGIDLETVRQEKERLAELTGGAAAAAALKKEVRALMWRHAGVAKTEPGLREARARLSELNALSRHVGGGPADPREIGRALEAHHMACVAELIVVASLQRKETRGQFWRLDYPEPDNELGLSHVALSRGSSGVVVGRRKAVMTRLRNPPTCPFVGCGCSNYLRPLEAAERPRG